MTITVTHVELRPDGTPWANRPITVAIGGNGYRGDGTQVLQSIRTTTGNDGSVLLTLEPNVSGGYYVWTHTDGSQDNFTVPATGGPYTLQSLLTLNPFPTTPGAITQQAVMALLNGYVPQPTSGSPSNTTYLRGDGTWATPPGGVATVDTDGMLAVPGSKRAVVAPANSGAPALGAVAGYDGTQSVKVRWFTMQESVARALGWVIVTDSRWAGGADPTGTTDSYPAISAALASLGSGQGTVWLPPGTYLISGLLVVADGVGFRGAGGALGNCATILKCTASGAGVQVNGSGGEISHFKVDGNSVATQPFLRYKGSDRLFLRVNVVNSASHNIVVQYSQNDTWNSCQEQNAAGRGLVLDLGCGGLSFERCELTGNSAGSVLIQQSATTGSPYYSTPSHIKFNACIFERQSADVPAFETTCAASGITVAGCVLDGYHNTSALAALAKVGGAAQVVFEGCRWFNYGSTPATQPTVSLVSAGSTAYMNGLNQFFTYGPDFDAPSGTQIAGTGSFTLPSSRTSLTFSTGTSSNGDATVFSNAVMPRSVRRQATSSWIEQSSVTGDAGIRYRRLANGDQQYVNGGGSYTPTSTFGELQANSLANKSGSLSGAVSSVSLASAGTVTVDASKGNVCQVLLSANASGITITNPQAGMRLTIELVQSGASGPYTWVAPTAKWAGGTAPVATATARYAVDVLTLFHDGNGWVEIGRALNCH